LSDDLTQIGKGGRWEGGREVGRELVGGRGRRGEAEGGRGEAEGGRGR